MTVARGLALGACILALGACGNSSRAPAKAVGIKSATGRHASATASVGLGGLTDLSVHVVAMPAQRVKGGWVVTCTFSATGTSRDSADFAGRTPLDVPVRFTTQPQAKCELVAVATLARSGRLRVELRGRQSS